MARHLRLAAHVCAFGRCLVSVSCLAEAGTVVIINLSLLLQPAHTGDGLHDTYNNRSIKIHEVLTTSDETLMVTSIAVLLYYVSAPCLI